MVRLVNCTTGLVKGYTTTKGVKPKSGKTVFRYRVGAAKPVVVTMRNNVKTWKVKAFQHVRPKTVVRLQYKKGHRWVLLSKATNTGCG
jgi:hypothetical protein